MCVVCNACIKFLNSPLALNILYSSILAEENVCEFEIAQSFPSKHLGQLNIIIYEAMHIAKLCCMSQTCYVMSCFEHLVGLL